MNRKRVLFVCIHNSARSQMAEEILRSSAGDRFDVESAGIEPGTLNSFVVEVLKEIDIDISNKKTKSVFYLLKEEKKFDYIITVCDETNAEKCPVFPSNSKRIHWSFQDPSCFEGTKQERFLKTREVRDQIREKIKSWLKAQKQELSI